jgi:multidrug efflux pump subunit AcrA (membrane-fusion protein)
MAETGASIEAVIPGHNRRATGVITMIDNTVDPTTGMATLHATMPNANELLWPGSLVTRSRCAPRTQWLCRARLFRSASRATSCMW